MSGLAHQGVYINAAPGKLGAAPPESDVPNLRVVNGGQNGSSPDIQLDAGALHEELALVRTENADLRQRLEQSEQLLHAAAASEEVWLERHKEYEALLEEKSDVIRSLHQKIHELQETNGGQNIARADELNQFMLELDARKTQLREDEAGLVNQMRSMELALSRDRAELARQRNTLERLQAEVEHEIAMASRDPNLRERLANLTRRSAEHTGRVAPKTQINIELPPLTLPSTEPTAPPTPPAPRTGSGFLRRIFGG